MLARPERHRCIECGKPYDALGFAYYHGNIDDGPAYWCDRGILCSSDCSFAHWKKRAAEGTLADMPADEPFDFSLLPRR